MPDWMQEFVDPEDTARAVAAMHMMQPTADSISSASFSSYNPTQADPHTRTIHWPPYNDASSTGSVGTNVLNPAHFGPGGIISAPGALADVFTPVRGLAASSAGTVSTANTLLPGSYEGRSTATGSALSRTIDSSTGSTTLDPRIGSEISRTATSEISPTTLDPRTGSEISRTASDEIFAQIDAATGVSSGGTSVSTADTTTTVTTSPESSAKSFLGSLGTGKHSAGTAWGTVSNLSKDFTDPDAELDTLNPSSKSTVAGGSIEMQNLGGRTPMRPFDTAGGTTTTGSSVYDGDSDLSGHTSVAGSDGVSINTEVVPGSIELQPLAGTLSAPSMPRSELGDLPDVPELGFLLDDLPGPSAPFELGNLGIDDVAPAPPGLSDFVGDLGNVALAPGGIGIAANKLMNFAKARVFDLGLGLALTPFFSWVDQQTGTGWTSRMVQLTMATTGFLFTADPFGLIAAPIGWAIQEFIDRRQRVLDNDDPEKIRGKKWGFVREGKNWYPAVTESQSKDEGGGTDRSVLMLKYGSKVKWEQEKGTGNWVPTFENARFKEFKVSNKEIYGAEAGKVYQERADPLRDFYLLDDDETTKMLTNFAGGDVMRQFSKEDGHVFTDAEKAEIQANQKQAFDMMQTHEVTSWSDSWKPIAEGGNGRRVDGSDTYETEYFGRNMAPLVDSILDSRDASDMIHDYRHSQSGKVDRASGDFWEGSIKLRRLINEQRHLGDAQWAASARYTRKNFDGVRASYWDLPEGVYEKAQAGDWTELDKWTRAKGRDTAEDAVQNDYYLEQFRKELDNLLVAQKQAASSMGFKEKYNFDMSKHADMPDSESWYMSRVNNDGWSGMYLDNSWQIPEMRTADQLHDELLDIEEAGDPQYMGTSHFRNTQQQQYLAQKAIVRYWAKKLDTVGAGADVASAYHDVSYANVPIAFWQEGDDPDSKYGLGLHLGADEGIRFHGQTHTESPTLAEDSKVVEALGTNIGTAMQGLEKYGVIGGINDPDFVAGHYKDFETYWHESGKRAPQIVNPETNIVEDKVWDADAKVWRAPWEEPPKAEAYTPKDHEVAHDDWTPPTFDDGTPDIPPDWTYNRTTGFATAPDGSSWDPYMIEKLWEYNEELKRHAAERKAKADADAKAAADADAKAKADADAKAKADADAAAVKDAGTTHAHGEDPKPPHPAAPVKSWTFHHEEPLVFQHDQHVPMHIPTSKIAADNLADHSHAFHPNVAPAHVPQIKVV